ncbi:hypothetical protein JMJ77_0005555 [Colletotrichum scovillei]|uniref:Uncharacterized protein n=1 Tax=Colletotrichum scovillei TaxID=1209932 RepID=A0A9P7RHF9_9PEZI|nr:hypothetical protein JMJ77_0005555 [Colletotrichum scovillei]KAG7076777.1 hypothetical protein JMJ76_0014036 [Colletotrichum scovillei]KAG7083911.1 hypothetical protein JMJ78_0009352 [Colletotrichum scovillei]
MRKASFIALHGWCVCDGHVRGASLPPASKSSIYGFQLPGWGVSEH